ncbi:uncharacterized protein LOC115881253 [Sitophilus oryzae]|uniref:Uncharacterized protein LOC115881253 n=1 Tax=Sitophilus oryzae TaxID=7048 RepID=A0A6J2XUS3_SITOR|nr:uncharacterized protein LOC115881253 [Sitophilus oryzae]
MVLCPEVASAIVALTKDDRDQSYVANRFRCARSTMDSLEEHEKLQSISEVETSPKSSKKLSLPGQGHQVGNSITSPMSNNNISPSLSHSSMYNKANVKHATAPRIDISRASSSSHHDSRDSSPEREILDNIDAATSKLGTGFKEDGAIDLKSSTEELDFQEPYEYRKSRDKTCSSPVPDESYLDHRKDSQCSDVVLLSISGRTSRLSSIGSQGSAKSRLSNASHLSIVSAQSAYSRCSSPHKTLLETSFCGSRTDCREGFDNTSIKGDSEEFEKLLLSSRNSNSSDVVLLESLNVSSPKQPNASIEIAGSVQKPSKSERQSEDKDPNRPKLPRKIVSKSGVEYIYIPLKGPLPIDDSEEESKVTKPKSRPSGNTLRTHRTEKSSSPNTKASSSRTKTSSPNTKASSSHAKTSKSRPVVKDSTPKPTVNVHVPQIKKEEPKYIRIKLKPDHCYDDDGKAKPNCENYYRNEDFRSIENNVIKPNTLNLPFPNEDIVQQPDDQLTCVVVKKQARSLTNTPSVSPKFNRRKLSNNKDSTPSPSVARRNSFACLFKSKDLVVSPESIGAQKHKRKNTLSGILKTPTSRSKTRSKSKDRDKSSNAPSSTESIDSKGRHKSVLSIFRSKEKQPATDNCVSGAVSKKTLAEKRGGNVNNINCTEKRSREQEKPLNSDSIRIPLHSPTYYEDENFKQWNTNSQKTEDSILVDNSDRLDKVDVVIEKVVEDKLKPEEHKRIGDEEKGISCQTVITNVEVIEEVRPNCTTTLAKNDISILRSTSEESQHIPISNSTTITISTVSTKIQSETDGVDGSIVQLEGAERIVTNPVVKKNMVIDDDLNSSESERDSVEEYVRCPKNLALQVETRSFEIEREAIVLQQDSFEDELPYVPTTLPQERSAAVPIIPVKQRCVSSIKTFSIERPRSTTPIQSSALENYCDDFVGKVKTEPKAVESCTEKIKITLPECSKTKTQKETIDGEIKPPVEETPPPLPPKGVQKSWINFEEVPERRKPPKRIQTIPSRGHIDVPEFMVKDNIVYTYVNPEECKCECHESKEKERKTTEKAGEKVGEKIGEKVSSPSYEDQCSNNAAKAQQKKHNWMNDDILHLMEERRSFKNQDQQKYQLINKEIRKKIRAAKEAWFVNQCKEVEELQKRHDTFNLHKRVKELTGVNTNRTHNLVDKDGNLIVK